MTARAGTPVRVVVVGAGGLGSYLAAALADAGHTVTAVARGEHGSAIRTEGLRVVSGVNEAVGKTRVVHRIGCVERVEDAGPQDLALVTVKTFSLDEVAPGLAALAERGTTVMPLLNGIDALERLQAAGVRAETLLAGVAYLTAFRTAPGRIVQRGTHARLVVGALSEAASQRLAPTVDAFSGTDLEVGQSDDIRRDLWLKMAVVCTLSALCGTSGSSLGSIREHPRGRSLQARAVGEVLAVANAAGVQLDGRSEAQVTRILDDFPDDFYPSLLHDLRGGRRTEIAALCGTIRRLGSSYGVDTPVHDMATWAVEIKSLGRDRRMAASPPNRHSRP